MNLLQFFLNSRFYQGLRRIRYLQFLRTVRWMVPRHGGAGLILAGKIWDDRQPEVTLVIPGYLHAITFRSRESDPFVVADIFGRGIYDHAPEDETIRTVIDAGTNIGMSTVYLTHKYPQATILALEPDRENFTWLQKNTAPYPRIEALSVGLWSQSGYLRIANPESEAWSRQVEFCAEKEAVCCAVSVPDLLRRKNWGSLDLLKLDIEGAEREVLLADDVSWLKKLRYLLVEFDGERWEETGE